MSRNGHRSGGFQALCTALGDCVQAKDAILDGEIVCLGPDGRALFDTPAKSSRTMGLAGLQGCEVLTPTGQRIGWLDVDDLFLDSAESYRAAQALAGRERLPVSEQTLRQRCAERGVLVSVDQARQMLKVRRMIEGEQRQVSHLRASELLGNRWEIDPH